METTGSVALSGVVLAAGRSTRMGRDKALLEVDGVPLWQRQQRVLVAAGATEIFLSARPDQAWARQAKGFAGLLHDALPGCGPIVGITAAMERATHPRVAVIGVDLPAMTPYWFLSMLAGLPMTQGAVARQGDFFEPLAAIYPRSSVHLFWEALARAEYSLQPVIARAVSEGLMREVALPPGAGNVFANWNTGPVPT